MTLNEFAEKIERRLGMGIHSDESRWNRDYIIAKCNDARAIVLKSEYIKTRRWPHSVIQSYAPKYQKLSQTNDCVIRFKLPTSFIGGDSLSDGFISIGNDVVNKEANPFNYNNVRRIKNRDELLSMMKHPVMKKVMLPCVLIEGLNIEFYTKSVIYDLRIYGVFYEPQKLTGFRADRDDFILSGDLAAEAEEIAYKTLISAIYEPDKISNTKEDRAITTNR